MAVSPVTGRMASTELRRFSIIPTTNYCSEATKGPHGAVGLRCFRLDNEKEDSDV